MYNDFNQGSKINMYQQGLLITARNLGIFPLYNQYDPGLLS